MTARVPGRSLHILMADDDPDDRLLAEEALEESKLPYELTFVGDGVELMDYLRATGTYAGRTSPLPGVILLDLNMPRMDGREAILALKSDPALRRIPVVVMTTSQSEEDILRTYDLGVNSFIIKPVSFDRLVEVMRTIGRYWFDIVELPQTISGNPRR